MIAQTIPELTGDQYNELRYDASSDLIVGDYIYDICDLLDKCGIDVPRTNEYNEAVADGVFRFQESAKLSMSGVLDTNTFQALILYADKISDVVENEEEATIENIDLESDSPHYNSFFDGDKYKMHRKNHKDIKISFGDNSITKTIKNVFMLSVSIEVDTSGNPISEVYEFIAQDVVESDEISDVHNYEYDTHETSSLMQYNFPNIN